MLYSFFWNKKQHLFPTSLPHITPTAHTCSADAIPTDRLHAGAAMPRSAQHACRAHRTPESSHAARLHRDGTTHQRDDCRQSRADGR